MCYHIYIFGHNDYQLNWSDNNYVCFNKSNQKLFFLRKLGQFNSNILQLFYQATIKVYQNLKCVMSMTFISDFFFTMIAFHSQSVNCSFSVFCLIISYDKLYISIYLKIIRHGRDNYSKYVR